MCLETRNRRLKTLAAIGVLFASTLALAQVSPSQVTPKVGSDPGLITVTFVLPNGAVYVNLPEDMSPGDTLSGSVTIDSGGATEIERAQNLAELTKYSIEVAGKKSGTGNFTFTLPNVTDVAGRQPVPVMLIDSSGHQLGKTEVPTRPVV